MNNNTAILANSIAWAAAIIASAALGAPTLMTLVLLPALATVAWLANGRSVLRRCQR